MRTSLRRIVAPLLLACAGLPCAGSAEPAKPTRTDAAAGEKTVADEAGVEFFERRIRPLLAGHCFSCHGRGQRKGGLGLDSRAALLAGGESGTSVVLGKPDESLLLEAVGYAGGVRMPPSGKLADDEIAALRQWIALGAPWPAEPTPAAGGPTIRTDGLPTAADRAFWSFQPIRDPAPPPVKNEAWPRRPLDRFILARLEAEGLRPVGEADRRTFIRRATFDVLGLPPTAEETDAFVADARPDAFERLVDRLLASPHYGERRARHWLDLARYGEDQAHTFQARLYPNGYRYRDWVVEAFNRDLPYDRFLLEQIAADLLPDGDRMQRLPALGFFALGPVYYADAGCAGKAKTDEYDDRIDTLSRGLLGLTVSCARCHDHKFDPISMRDYYGLAGIFAGTQYVEAPLAAPEVVKRYEDEQASIKQAEQRWKDAQALEVRRLGESLAEETAEYLTAVAALEGRRRREPNYSVDAAAKESGLNAAVLERWRQRLEADRASKHPLFAAWRALPSDAADAAVRTAATELENVVVAAVRKRRASETAPQANAESKPPALDAATLDVLKTVVDDRSAPLALPKEQVDKLLSTAGQARLAALQAALEERKRAAGPKYPFAHALADGAPVNLKIHLRGNHKDLGDEAPRRFPAVLTTADAAPFSRGSGREELARAIASRDNPLTARVFVNRVWQQLFGRGIVGTPSNFGLLGERPTHPELLDHLASRFLASGWSVKALHREILLSATYRLASTFDAACFAHDPDERLRWRMSRRRLDVESWRDAVLAASGELDRTLGGPSFGLNDAGNRRRTLYAAISRHDLHPMLRLFDFPDPNLTSERRVVTTVPMQQLFVLNGEFVIRQAKALAARLDREKPPNDAARIDRVYRLTLGRSPTAAEAQLVRAFLAAAAAERDVRLSPWEQVAQTLLGTNEFTYLD